MHLFKFNPNDLPGCAFEDRAQVGWDRFFEAAQGDDDLKAFAEALKASEAGQKLGQAVFGNSPFLTSCWLKEPQFAKDLLEQGPKVQVDAALKATRTESAGLDDAALKRHLRIQKRRIALATAIGDIAGIWDLSTVTKALSDFADAATSAACAFHLLELNRRGKIKLKDLENPELGSGLVVLGMGKLGGYELNYSSDIDLIILYDPECLETDAPMELGQHFVRLARGVVSTLDDRTADGYVFRTDLRLRPDPGSTPLAISTLAAEVYYESIGQNWERAAMIKARPVAGDKVAGQKFLDFLTPFIWRKSLDFATIHDIQTIKRQINTHRGGHSIKLLGHNVKLGCGGIREIEFYAQTQQLIWGGRDRSLRTVPTRDSLTALVNAEIEKAENAITLTKAYEYLRKVEHRIQMVDDEQTHTLPDTDEGVAHIATFMGYDDLESFSTDILATLGHVEKLFGQLFEDESKEHSETAEKANLVFTGTDCSPETLLALEDMGYANVLTIDTVVRGWHHSRYRAMRSTRARALMEELIGPILTAMSNTSEPDKALLRFDEFLSKLPAGVQLFSMFQSNPSILDLIADIMGTAPRLAEHLAKKVGVLDGVLTSGFFEDLPSTDEMKDDLDHDLEEASCMEDVLDICRRWAKDRKFQVGVQVLKGSIREQQSQQALTEIAEILLQTLQPRVEAEFAIRHGHIPGGSLGILAYGKLGGREKTPTSDMDLAFVYTHDADAEASDGEKPLAISQYYTRLCQRIINAVSVPTAEGMLYEVDMRLRPRGNSGPVATSVDAFEKYQKTEAWTWEHMALTRARMVTGNDDLKTQMQDVITDILKLPKEPQKLVVDVADMRERMDKERHTDQIWSIKNYRGGLVDIEFIAQYLQLLHGSKHPEILSPTTHTALQNLKDAGLLDPKMADGLIEALVLWQSLQGLLRLTFSVKPDRNDMPKSLRRYISRIAETENVKAAEEKIKAKAEWVLNTFNTLIVDPAQTARPNVKSDLQS
ncbi:MAG: bifunctional [glutamate--ammonia ligase]-adenylyl-L-tyrosine phosphorylase/[glutamate--ammonia-ligase] adenylyltransferase [Rhodospirillaceae bacterium]|nr:MAG: bifunctional [glutamate--ammonia ligase]-adenylyl-L-tyrosine phosphorylase/[glutamate--ammonia-ligase] adenylyltransferase [Rhodospirillaceae bacterium]